MSFASEWSPKSVLLLRTYTAQKFLSELLAGLMLIFMGVTGLGSAVRFIPRPVVIGFTNGIAVLIASTQIKDFFGLRISNVPGDFWGRIETILHNFRTISPVATSISVIG